MSRSTPPSIFGFILEESVLHGVSGFAAMRISSQREGTAFPTLTGMNASLRVVEKLEPSRIAARAIGALIAISCLIVLAVVLVGVYRATAGGNTALIAWAGRSPILATMIAVVGAFGVAAFALVTTWLPGRRVFSFDRSSVYVTVDRRTSRYGIAEVSVSGEPPRLHLRGQSFALEAQDYERLAGFLRVVSHHPPRFKPMAAVKQTIIESSRPLRQLFTGSARHPTQV